MLLTLRNDFLWPLCPPFALSALCQVFLTQLNTPQVGTFHTHILSGCVCTWCFSNFSWFPHRSGGRELCFWSIAPGYAMVKRVNWAWLVDWNAECFFWLVCLLYLVCLDENVNITTLIRSTVWLMYCSTVDATEWVKTTELQIAV